MVMTDRRMALLVLFSGLIVLAGLTVVGYLIVGSRLGELDPTAPFSAQGDGETQAARNCYFVPSERTLSLYLAPVYANSQLGERVSDAAERYRVARQQGAFYYLTLDNADVGWVSAYEGQLEGDCTIIADDEILLKEFGSLCLVTTTGSTALYATPEMTDVTGMLPAGSYPIYVISGDRYLVGSEATGGGWIDAASGSLDGACAGVPDEPLAQTTAIEGAQVWPEPGASGEPALTLAEGDVVQILAGPLLVQPDPAVIERTEWYRVRTRQGAIGWMPAESMTFADEPAAG